MDHRPHTPARLAAGLIKALAGLTVFPLLFRRADAARTRAEANRLLARFAADSETGLFQAARPISHAGTGSHPDHGVLLLHGFSAGPGQFATLADQLTKAGLAHHAPLLTGFGLTDNHLLERVTAADWRRDAETAFDLLAARHGRVSVVGHSMGAALAVWLAGRRPVDHLVLTNPYLNAPESDIKWQKRFNRPLLGRLLAWWRPLYLKNEVEEHPWRTDIRDPEAAAKAFHIPAMPPRILFTLWEIQGEADPTRARFRDLNVVYGVHDDTADIPALLAGLKAAGIAHTATPFENSGHNVLQDFDRQDVARIITDILIAEPAAPEAN